MTDWRIKDGDGNIESELFDVELTTNADNFGDGAVAFLDDSSGNKFDEYPRGTRIDFEAKERSANSYSTQLVTYVVERREKDNNGADVLELECYDVTMLLRRGEIKTDLSGQSISSALEDIIKNSTPVTYNSANVTVANDVTVTRSYLNERTDVVLEELALKSGNEEFFVNESIEFVWRPRESEKVSRGVDNSQWFDYDIPETAKDGLNEVRVYYDDGDKAVTVDNPSGKKELQDNLGTDRPVTFSEEKSFEDIDNRDDAIAAGQEFLNGREPTLTGTVTTYGLLDAEPGDAIDIRVKPRGINGEFRIAQIEYRWGRDETELTIVENRGDIDDMLKRMSDTLKRVEMRNASDDPDEDDRQVDIGGPGSGDSVGVRILSNTTGDIDGTDLTDTSVVTNTGLNAIRDAYINNSTVSISTIKVGTGSATPSRADSSLDSSSESVSATVSTPDNSTVRVTGSFTTGDDIQEVGFFDGSDNLLARGITQTAVTGPDSSTIDIEFKDDDSTPNSVITQTGQTLLRDILAANSPTHVDRYVLGSGTTDVSESDTSLATLKATTDIGGTVLRDIDNTAGWTSAGSYSAPVIVSGGDLTLGQTAFTRDAQDLNTTNASTVTDSAYTGDTALDMNDTVNAQYIINPDYDGNWAIGLRGDFPDTDFELFVNNEDIDLSNLSSGVTWYKAPISQSINTNDDTVINLSKFSSSSSAELDVITFFDEDVHTLSNFDDDPSDSNNYLETPGNYGDDATTAALDSITGVRDNTSATLTTSWNDTTNGQALRLNGNTANNTDTNTFSINSTDTYNIEFDIDAFGTSTSETPTTRRNAQKVNSYQLSLGENGKSLTGVGAWSVRSFFSSSQVGGQTLTEGGQKDSNGDLVTRTRFSEVTPSADSGIIIDEQMVINVESRPEDTAFFAVSQDDTSRS